MKEEWLFPGAMVPVDVETTAALVAEIKRLIDVVGGMALAQSEQEQGEPVACIHRNSKLTLEIKSAYEKGFEHGFDSAKKREWIGLTEEDKQIAFDDTQEGGGFWEFADAIEAKLRSKNT